MKTYLLKIDATIWSKFKGKCASNNISMAEAIRLFIIKYIGQ